MADSKYGHFILRGTEKPKPSADGSPVVAAALEGRQDWGGIHNRISWKYISGPAVIADEPHTHDFDEFLVFLGNNPADADDFQAEIELVMGEEGEKHLIDSSTIICVPKGTAHCPLTVKSVGKPILFANVYLSPEYVRKPVK